MKKYPPIVAGVLLGLLFLVASITFFLKMVPEQKIPEGTPTAMFMGAFGPTGYMSFVKVFELVGGVLVMIPRLRNLGLVMDCDKMIGKDFEKGLASMKSVAESSDNN